MRPGLYWHDLSLGDGVIPASHIATGEHVRLLMPFPLQVQCLAQLFCAAHDQARAWQMWLHTEDGRYDLGSQQFAAHIGSLIRHHGLIANLTLGENLLLPFLYWGDRHQLQRAKAERDQVAAWLGIKHKLHERAGERSAYMHALMSLGRCMLTRPIVIVAQEVHIGMTPEHLQHFRALSLEAIHELGSGLLYLTESPDEGSGIEFARDLPLRTVDGGQYEVSN